jgi:hypothetical protein
MLYRHFFHRGGKARERGKREKERELSFILTE